jgi:tripartite-type tricarboxylate transporter receptor subunit TctC
MDPDFRRDDGKNWGMIMMIGNLGLRGHLLALMVVAAATPAAMAQDDAAKNYPSRPVHVVVGFSPGGGNDIQARIVGQKLSEMWHQSVIIDNKPGASAIIGTDFAARAAPDGYTIMVGPSGPMVVNPAVYSKLPYDTRRDFVAVSEIGLSPLILVVAPNAPFNSVADLVAYAKANPTKSNYGSTTPSFQLVAELFKLKTGAPGEMVAYKGSGDTVMAVVSGEILFAIADASPVSGQLEAGQVKGLASATAQRLPAFPKLPTMAEQDVADFDIGLWSGFFAPKATPPAIVKKLQDDIIAVMHMPETKAKFESMGLVVYGNTSAEFTKVIDADLTRWKEVADAAHIHIEQ